jgi:hypothetical protein
VAVYVIVDDSTGRVYEPSEISISVDLGYDGPHFRVDSSLMVVASCPDPRVYGLKNCQRNFYRWDGRRLILLSSEPVTKAECEREFPRTHCIGPNDFNSRAPRAWARLASLASKEGCPGASDVRGPGQSPGNPLRAEGATPPSRRTAAKESGLWFGLNRSRSPAESPYLRGRELRAV